MTLTQPSLARVEALRRRWEGEDARLAAIAADLLAGHYWTARLRGLAYVREIPPLPGEACGRDLRGADLRRLLVPPVEVREAREEEAALVSSISFEGLQHNTPLDGVTPFPVAPESADDIALAMRRGDRFLIARSGGKPVGVVRLGRRTDLRHLTADRDYAELSGLAVLPAQRRRGLGAALRAAAEAAASADGHEHVLLTTTMELGLVPWYERAGYKVSLVRQITCSEGTTYLDVVMVATLVRSTPKPAATGTATTPSGAAPATAPPRHRIYRCS
jgi:ribosomal protein S18 acetylase RimI-like enzyme